MSPLSCFFLSSHSPSHQAPENETINHARADEDEDANGCDSDVEGPENDLPEFEDARIQSLEERTISRENEDAALLEAD